MKRTTSVLSDNWDQLAAGEKRALRVQHKLDSGKQIKFVDEAAEKHYFQTLKRMIAVFDVREPDRVPVSIVPGVLPFFEDGIDYNIALHDPERALEASLKFNAKYSRTLDVFSFPFIIPANPLEKLNFKLYAWPGYGLSANATGLQFVEGEYMLADEYDAFLKNPSDFWMRTYLPRTFGVFEPLRSVSSLSDMVEFPIQLMHLANPEVRSALRTLADAGEGYEVYKRVAEQFARKSQENGFPLFPSVNGYTKAPFDAFGDNLRGTLGIMKDMYRQPEKLLRALDAMADLEIESVLSSPDAPRGLNLFFALHKGADGWMSQKQFDTFYWPSLKKVMNACIDEGFHLKMFVEGSYDTRLECFTEMPRGALHLWFDKTEIAKAKKLLGDRVCIEGNVPSSLLVTATPQAVKEHCRKLIEVCGVGGGYILGCGASIENPKLENLIAMVEAAREYGQY